MAPKRKAATQDAGGEPRFGPATHPMLCLCRRPCSQASAWADASLRVRVRVRRAAVRLANPALTPSRAVGNSYPSFPDRTAPPFRGGAHLQDERVSSSSPHARIRWAHTSPTKPYTGSLVLSLSASAHNPLFRRCCSRPGAGCPRLRLKPAATHPPVFLPHQTTVQRRHRQQEATRRTRKAGPMHRPSRS